MDDDLSSDDRATARTLYVDIETAPSLAHVWGLWRQNIGLNQLLASGRVICLAWRWRGEEEIHFASEHGQGRDAMLASAHRILSEADVVVHYNGKRFDIPTLNRDFMLAGKLPPAPFRQLDLLETVKRRFRFASNKLAHISQELGLEGKVKHEGHTLWVRCLAGDPEAWGQMAEYNKRDVVLLEQLHDVLMPWLVSVPNPRLTDGSSDVDTCPNCGSTDLAREGHAYTATGAYQRHRCRACGAWSRRGRRTHGVDIRPIANG